MFGNTVERWLAIGDAMVRVLTPAGFQDLTCLLRDAGHYVTVVNAQGRDGDVPRRKAPRLMATIIQAYPKAFITYEQTTPFRLAVVPAVRVRK